MDGTKKLQKVFVAEDHNSIMSSSDENEPVAKSQASTQNMSGYVNINANEVTIGTININSLNKNLEKVPSEYKDGLLEFAKGLNEVFKQQNVPKEKATEIETSIKTLGKEVENIPSGNEEEVGIGKRAKIEGETTDLIEKILNAIPPAAETVIDFTPLHPFSKIIRKGIEKIVDAVKESRQKAN